MIVKVENVDFESKQKEPTLFEDVITLTGFGKFNLFIIFIAGIILTQTIAETVFGIFFVLPIAQCDLQLTTEDKGILGSIAFFGIIVSSHLWGFLADVFGRKKIIQTTLFLSFIFTVISSFANGFWFLLIFRFLSGFFISGSSATTYAYLSEFHNKKNQSSAIYGATIIFGVACLVFPWIAWIVLNQDWEFFVPIVLVNFKPWRLYLMTCAFPSFICASILFALPESPKFVLLDGNQHKAIRIIKYIHKINNGHKAKDLKITSVKDEDSGESKFREDKKSLSLLYFLKLVWDQTAPLFYIKHLRTTLITCTIQFGTLMIAHGLVMWFPTFINIVAEYTKLFPNQQVTFCEILLKTDSFKTQEIANSTSFMNECSGKLDFTSFSYAFYGDVICLLGFIATGVTVNYVGKLPIILFILILCGTSGVLTTFVTSPTIAVILFITLLQSGIVTPIINLASVELYPTNLRAMAVCISLMVGRLGSVFGSTLTGYFLKYSCNGTFWFYSATLYVCAFLSFFIPKIFDRTTKN